MSQSLAVLAGASRGLGRALAEQLLARGHRVLALARSPAALLVPADASLVSWSVDLADAAPVAARLETWLQGLDTRNLASATLINNAIPGNASSVHNKKKVNHPSCSTRNPVEALMKARGTAARLVNRANWVAV